MQYSVQVHFEPGTSTSTSPQGKAAAEGQLIHANLIVITSETGHSEYLRLLDLRLSIGTNPS